MLTGTSKKLHFPGKIYNASHCNHFFFIMDPASLLIFCILLLVLIFFAGTEIPLMSVSDHTIESFIKHHRFGARTLKHIKKQNERLLMTNLIGTTAVTIAISSFSTLVAIGLSSNL